MARPQPAPPSQKDGEVMLRLSGGAGDQSTASVQQFIFPIRPESFTIEQPARSTVIQTIGGAFQEHLGPGLPTITLSGTTGWRGHTTASGARSTSGYDAFLTLRGIHEEYLRRCASGDPASVILELTVALVRQAQAAFGHYQVSSESYQTSLSKQNPLLQSYQIRYIVLKIMGSGGAGPTSTLAPAGTAITPTQLQAAQTNQIQVAISDMYRATGAAGTLAPVPYVVQVGDTTQSIAKNQYGSAALGGRIAQANRLTSEAFLNPGMLIYLPQEPV